MEISVQKSHQSPLFADAMLFLAVLGWSVSFPIAKLAMIDWGSYKFFFLAGRFWLAFAIFAVFAMRSCSWQGLVAHAKPGFWVGITLVATFGFQYKAISLGTSGEVAFITALNSVLVPIGLWVVFRQRVQVGLWLGLIVATFGAILVGYEGSLTISSAGWLAFVSAVGMAADIILIDYFLGQKVNGVPRYEKVPFLTTQFFVLAIATTVLALVTEVWTAGLPAWSNNAVFGMVFMAIVATAGAFFIQTKYQPMTRPERAALVFILEPPFAALFGFLLLREAFTLVMVIGAAMILAGVGLAEFLAARRASVSSDGQLPPPKEEESLQNSRPQPEVKRDIDDSGARRLSLDVMQMPSSRPASLSRKLRNQRSQNST